MASSTLIGTAPDQVPTNGDLGDLAFQNKEFVEFYDGRGGLSHLDITAISRQLSVSATDVFIYDTSKDSDGGAWRKRCQHTSWYNEPLNTAIRGSRREFPSVAVIVATTTSVIIYDGDDPAMPMWMMFNQGGSWPNNNIIGQTGSGSLTSVVALNGTVSVSLSGDSFRAINFISELTKFWWGAYYREYKGFIVSRNSSSGWTDTASPYASIPSNAANDIAMTVLANAPIDAATGLPIPTIAVATAGGVSLIRDNGTVDLTHTASSVDKIVFVGTTLFALCQGSGVATSWDVNTDLPAGNGTNHLNGDWNGSYWFSYTYPSTRPPIHSYQSNLCNNKPIVGGSKGLSILSGLNNTGESTAFIASTYNTGWMPGDIRGAWLSDTTQETVFAAINLIENGTFNSGVSSWNGGPLSWDSSNQRAQITGTGLYGGISQTFSTIAGKCYYFEADVNCSTSDMDVRIQIAGIGSQDGSVNSNTGSGNKKIYGWFLATAESHTLQLIPYGVNFASTYYVDNVIMIEVQPDRSVKKRGLQVFGSITKTPVAAGADLVAYSGFSSSNYLMQPYNSALQNSSSAVTVSCWLKIPSGNPDSRVIWIGGSTSSESGGVSVGTYTGYMRNHSGGVWNMGTSPFYYPVDTWFQFIMVVDGATGKVSEYANGRFVQTWQGGTSIFADTGQPTVVGTSQYYRGGPYYYFAGSIALLRISATAPSAEQIAKMYNDEKVLFQDNAKATLYGTSDAVTALAYDEDTNLLHVGTSSGRSIFNGLRRVDNTTDAVGACISAAGGLVVED